jgi:phenylacetate-coenzyme A ligase PaaK-like adenylate-forming protein
MKGGKSEDLRKRIVDSLQAELQVKPAVQILPTGTIPVTEGDKAKRVDDKRSL